MLIIPKGKYIDLDDFNNKASPEEMGFLRSIQSCCKLGISINEGNGYRTLSNIGENGGQEVPHPLSFIWR